jgi:hypothetical protein
MRDGDGAAEGAAEGVEVLGGLAGEAVGGGVERVVLVVKVTSPTWENSAELLKAVTLTAAMPSCEG